MKQKVTESMFCLEFENRRPSHFTYAGLQELFSYFEDMDENCGEETEVDCVGICCDWAEVTFEANECPDEALKAAGHGYTLAELQERTTVIRVVGAARVSSASYGRPRLLSVLILQY